MRVLLVSTYELGHQPLHVASPAAALRRAGHDVRCLDLSVERWDAGALEWAQAAGFSVPMHTAMRLAMRAAAGVRRARPELPVCFYGLYAPVSRDVTVGALAAGGRPDARADEALIQLGRGEFELPARDLLPPLERYAHLALGGDERLVGYVEASHGCVHRCRHCPVPPVYDGRIRIVGADTVQGDIASLVELGARHITFGDPDFLNGRRHSLRVVQAMHERFPDLTFDCTTKVEHILRDAELLERLDKGHDRGSRPGDRAAARARDRDAAVVDAVHPLDDARRRRRDARLRGRARPRRQRRSGAVHDPPAAPRGIAAGREPRRAPAPRRLRRRAAQLQVDPDRPRQRPPPGPPRGARRAERGGLRADPRDVREGARGGAPGGWAIAVARRPRRADPRRLDRGEATAHRPVG